MSNCPIHDVHAEDLYARDEGGFGDGGVPDFSLVEFFTDEVSDSSD